MQTIFQYFYDTNVLSPTHKIVEIQPDDDIKIVVNTKFIVAYFSNKFSRINNIPLDDFYVIAPLFPSEKWFKVLGVVRAWTFKGRVQSAAISHALLHVTRGNVGPIEIHDVTTDDSKSKLLTRLVRDITKCEELLHEPNNTSRKKVGDDIKGFIAGVGGRSGQQIVRTPERVLTLISETWGNYHDPCPINPQTNGLTSTWKQLNFVNPPFKYILPWVNKAISEATKGKKTILLVPISTSTYWWRMVVCTNFVQNILLLNQRMKFVGHKSSLPKPLVFIFFSPDVDSPNSLIGHVRDDTDFKDLL